MMRGGDLLVECDAGGLQRLLACKCEQTADQRRRTPRRRKSIDHELLRPVGIRQKPLGNIQAQNDDTQNVVEIMRHPTGQRADGFHFRRLPQRFLGSLALGEVA